MQIDLKKTSSQMKGIEHPFYRYYAKTVQTESNKVHFNC